MVALEDFVVATFNDNDYRSVAEAFRTIADYCDRIGSVRSAASYRKCADELDPPALKCTHQTCDEFALVRLSADATDELPARITYRCELHIASWVVMNVLHGTVKVNLI
jgi:hypothetical protein